MEFHKSFFMVSHGKKSVAFLLRCKKNLWKCKVNTRKLGSSWEMWHRRLDHMNEKKMQNLAKKIPTVHEKCTSYYLYTLFKVNNIVFHLSEICQIKSHTYLIWFIMMFVVLLKSKVLMVLLIFQLTQNDYTGKV